MPSQVDEAEKLSAEVLPAVHQTSSQPENHGEPLSQVSEGGLVEPKQSVASKNSKQKKRRKGGRTKANRGPTALPRSRGTGFEEFFADPPMTPGEAAEEKQEIYARLIPFEERIQSCIQRFRSRRRLQGDQPFFFNEYLFLGGIDTSSNAFSGLDNKDLKDLTPAERRDVTATDVVHTDSNADERFYTADADHWSVDFAGVAAGFFSTSLGLLTGFEPKKVEVAISIVEHFLRYVLQHDVCPEYEEDVKSALQVCKQARKEWPMLNQLSNDLPGRFNLAATELFSTVDPEDWSFLRFSRPKDSDAKTDFFAVCTLCNEASTIDWFLDGNLTVSRVFSCTVEVTKVELPSEDTLQKFASLHIEGNSHATESVGKVFFKRAVIEDEWVQPKVSTSTKDNGIWVYLENKLIKNVVLGMKMEMTVIELNTGIRIIKTISKIVPSFYTFLPQHMMKHYKARREWDRPAPSVHDPNAEEALAARADE
ncbi:hypothetical protein QQS21_012780 [Conoideocrella luteorostrata]|uniref:Argonaute complex, subunit Arb1 n=1 Tax=Conoideocrella luteorostrata TaxID=1105319 RepID=A0AAJ0FSD6_9HYPO|nr:hypothetical protein QQS21_012780 [Conoideocrella luteorostrata]